MTALERILAKFHYINELLTSAVLILDLDGVAKVRTKFTKMYFIFFTYFAIRFLVLEQGDFLVCFTILPVFFFPPLFSFLFSCNRLDPRTPEQSNYSDMYFHKLTGLMTVVRVLPLYVTIAFWTFVADAQTSALSPMGVSHVAIHLLHNVFSVFEIFFTDSPAISWMDLIPSLGTLPILLVGLISSCRKVTVTMTYWDILPHCVLFLVIFCLVRLVVSYRNRAIENQEEGRGGVKAGAGKVHRLVVRIVEFNIEIEMEELLDP